MWAVDASGVIGYVTDPAHALEQLGEALDDFTESREMATAEYGTMCSLRNTVDAFREYAAAFLMGVAPVFFDSGRGP